MTDKKQNQICECGHHKTQHGRYYYDNPDFDTGCIKPDCSCKKFKLKIGLSKT